MSKDWIYIQENTVAGAGADADADADAADADAGAGAEAFECFNNINVIISMYDEQYS